jgi:hypothetical protein
MQTFGKRAACGVFATALVLGAAACADDAQPTLSGSTPAASAAATGPAHERLATLVALGFRDASVRAQFRAATAASKVGGEGKLHLGSYLRGEGQPLVRAIARATGVSQDELLGLIAQTGPLEIYLPVDAHRAAWKGGEDVIVAAQIDEDAVPFGVDLAGRRVALSLDKEPATPVISIVPAESFEANGLPVGKSLSANRIGMGGPNLNMNPDGSWTGLWVMEVHTSQEYEPWTKGDPEFEMTMENANTRGKIVCADEDMSIEPYRFNMDGTNYYNDFLIAAENEMPVGEPFTIFLYEDDDTRCVVKDDKDYAKLAADALQNAYSAYKAIKARQFENGQFIVKIYNAYVAFKSIVTGNDEFAGMTAGISDVGPTATTFQLKDQNMNNVGWVSLQYRTGFAQ